MTFGHQFGWCKYSLDGSTLDKTYVTETATTITLHFPCTSKSSCFPYVVDLEQGSYFIEMYGASGGKGRVIEGGTGGYSSGYISIPSQTRFFVFIGGQGSTVSGSSFIRSLGGFNGGGNGETGSLKVEAGSGGGATDIRMKDKSLSNRLLVAGGGGGTSNYGHSSQEDMIGGQGGGEKGGNGKYYSSQSDLTAGEGGSQTAPGKCQRSDGYPGIENVGGNGKGIGSSGGGGGGGYFGGGGGLFAGGGGGSGFVSPVLSSNPLLPSKTTNSTHIGNGILTITLLIKSQKCTHPKHLSFFKPSAIICFVLFS